MAAGKGNLERIRRGFRTLFFLLTLFASLLVFSAPVLVALGDVLIPCTLIPNFTCVRCYSFRDHLNRYGFRSSFIDIPFVSIIRSFIITCVYCMCYGSTLSHGPYLGTTIMCSLSSVLVLSVKACLFKATFDSETEASSSLLNRRVHFKKSWGMPILFLSSVVFALGHVVVAYRTSCKARRKLHFHRIDTESLLSCKNFCNYQKIPRSPTPLLGKYTRGDIDSRRRPFMITRDDELPIRLLEDVDSLFVSYQGFTIHYKICTPESTLNHSLTTANFFDSKSNASVPHMSLERCSRSQTQYHLHRSISNHFNSSSLHSPLLTDSTTIATQTSNEIPIMCLDDDDRKHCSQKSVKRDRVAEGNGKVGIILVHGFGGGVFSWRNVMGCLAQQVSCSVVAFDRPGWGLTSRPRRKDWEEMQLPNPYKLESQVDLLLSFCLEMGFISVVLVGHDDGGLLVLKAAEKIRCSDNNFKVNIKGIVLLSVGLSREVVPAFARILLHTSLGKKHLVRPLLRTEIIQVVNRRAWYDPTKLTTEVLNLYKAPLYVEGWDEAVHEVGRLSFANVLSSQNAMSLLRSIEDLPVLVVGGAEDTLVSLRSIQVMASKISNSRLVAISGCGHLPHEECPKALLAALSPFIARLLQQPIHRG